MADIQEHQAVRFWIRRKLALPFTLIAIFLFDRGLSGHDGLSAVATWLLRPVFRYGETNPEASPRLYRDSLRVRAILEDDET